MGGNSTCGRAHSALRYEGDARTGHHGQDEYWRLVAEQISQDPLELLALLAPNWRTKPADESGTIARHWDPLGSGPCHDLSRSGSTPAAPYFRFSRRPAAAGGLVVGYWHIKLCRLCLHWARVY